MSTCSRITIHAIIIAAFIVHIVQLVVFECVMILSRRLFFNLLTEFEIFIDQFIQCTCNKNEWYNENERKCVDY